MLQHLNIENYTLIKHLSIDFEDGFSVITGETGAGKSILLGALALLSGQRADTSLLFDKTKKSIIEAEFRITDYELKDFFDENDLDYDEVCIIRREITPQAKSRSFINDTPVSLSILKKIGEFLMDIHLQNTNLLLQNKEFQLKLIDQYAGLQKETSEFKALYKKYLALQKEYQLLFNNVSSQDKDYWEFLYKELEEANLQSGEQQELEHELGLLSNAEEIKQQLYAVAYHFAEGDTNLLSLLQENVNRLLQISKYDEGIEELSKRLQSQIIELKDIVFEIHKINENTQHNPQRIEQINQRLDVLYTLQQKHKVSTEADLMAIQNHLAEVLERIEHAEEEKQHMLLQIENEKQILYQKATLLSDKRKAVLKKMETDLQHVLQVLHMPSAHFDIRMEKSEHFHAAGLDKVVFWFTANPGTEMQTLEKSASGGELSRVMLALKSLISEKNVLPTIIFDEIDSGVSGEISAKMGKVMQKLATYSQIIAISHVPQIAAKAKNHYVVFKEVIKGETYSNIKKLTHLEHISEIAKMISNEKITESSLSAAKQLING